MATPVGNVGPYDSDSEDWTCYCERLEQFFVANDINDEDKRRAVLLSVCGSSVYQLVRNLLAPVKPSQKSFTELVQLVRNHFCPSPSVTVHRYNFNSRVQKEDETVSQFVAELRKTSEHCGFGDKLEDMLRDRLVCGTRNVSVQRRLLAETGLTFAKAFELAQAAELAEKNSRDIHRPVESCAVQVVQRMGTCFRCGGKHNADACKCKSLLCYKCGKQGHLSRMCHSTGDRTSTARLSGGARRRVEQHDKEESVVEKEAYTLFNVTSKGPNAPLILSMKVGGEPLQMLVDTGAAASIISESTYARSWPEGKRPMLEKADVLLRTYTGERIKVLGKSSVEVNFGDQCAQLELLVVEGNGPSLVGRDWLRVLKPNLSVFYAGRGSELEELMKRHSQLFKDELGRVKGIEVRIHVDGAAKPRFFKARPVPFALRGKVEQELERLRSEGIIEPVQFSDWAAPVVPVVKQDGSIRLCGDYKMTINCVANVDSYPLPRIDDLLASVTGAKVFSKLDLSHAYLQLPLEEGSKKFVTIATHKGLFRYNRLPFGIASAPAIFQRTMEGILQGIPHVLVYIDDILVADGSTSEHLETLERVMSRLGQYGVRLKEAKCKFMLPSVEYLGFHIAGDGIRPTEEKRRAITNAPPPEDVTQLKAFLGLVNYYSKFLPNLAGILAPLYKLLGKQQRWYWGKDQEEAFKKAKSLLVSDIVLAHFDPTKKLILSCDASPYGIGAVLSHEDEDGSDRPIAYASRSLAVAEKNYAQIEKEGLAIVWGVKKFHQFLFGREFVILSDHKPLQFLFSEKRPVPAMASSRIQRWALTLSAYKYCMVFRAGKEQGNSDGLSRLPLKEAPENVPQPEDTVLMLQSLSDMNPLVTASSIRRWTDRDPLLARVKKLVLQGWRPQENIEFKPYEQRRDELSVVDGCIIWGNRVIVPQPGRARVIDMLHEGHPGISRMKALARSAVWWPGLDAQLETKVKSCRACQEAQKTPPKSVLHPWEWPTRPWARVHVDFFGPFSGKHFFILVDAHSKWIDVAVVPAPSSRHAIQVLRHIFSTHGLPEILVSDNGSAFTSAEFQLFVQRNGFHHIKSAPYHPATNGLAERAVQTVKSGLKKTSGDMDTRLSRLLFQYRLTPHSTTGQSPAELLLKRKPRSHLDFLFPSLETRVRKHQEEQKERHDLNARHRSFQVGDKVYVLNRRGGSPKWSSGVITTILGPLTMLVRLEDGSTQRYHADHVRIGVTTSTGDEDANGMQPEDAVPPAAAIPQSPTQCGRMPQPDDVGGGPTSPRHDEGGVAAISPPPHPAEEVPGPEDEIEEVPVLPRRSTRPHRPPERYGL